MAINFNTEPYYDDFDANKDFYRILFQPGYAVQARELTQLQTILQEQTGRFGDHIFKNGSQVIPGSVNVDDKIHFIKLKDSFNNNSVSTYLSQFLDKIITGSTSGVKMRVIDTSDCDCVTTDKSILTLYCKVEDTADNGTTKRFIPGEDVVALEADNQVETNYKLTEDQSGDLSATVRELGNNGETGTSYESNPSSDVLGFAYGVDVKAGIYYIDGKFIRNDEMHLYIGRFSNKPTTRVGFKIVEEIITSEEDNSLLDNAQGTFNYAAPGAHRYKVSAELVELDIGGIDEIKFIELLRVVDGRIQHKIEKATYSELEKTLARRTYDESGNYEVNKFRLAVREHMDNGSNFGVYPEPPADVNDRVDGMTYGDEDKFVISVDPGKAYIQGYEVESVATQHIAFNKARENSISGDEGGHVVRVNDQPVPTKVGNYIIVDNIYHHPDINTFQEVYLVKTLTPSGNNGSAASSADIIGTARIKGIELDSSDYSGGTATKYKLGLMDIKMYSGYSFAKHVKRVTTKATSGNFTCDIVPTLSQLIGSASSSGTTITGVGTNFADWGVTEGDVVYINNTYIGAVSSSTVTNNSITLSSSAAATISGGTVQIFRAALQESDYSNLIFPVGQQFIKTLRGYDSSSDADTIKGSTIYVRRQFTAKSASSTSIDFELTNSNEYFLSDSNLENFLLVDLTSNQPVQITPGAITFTPSDADRKIVNFNGIVTSGRQYILIATVMQNNNAAAEKTLTLTSATQTITGAGALTGRSIELDKAYVLRITKVEMTPGDYSAYNDGNKIDITERFTLDDGQRNTYITNGSLKLKPGYQVPSGAIKVTMEYFQSGGEGNYFSVDSYAGVTYDEIPNYYITDPATGKKTEMCLSCVLDFRPVLGGSNTFYNELPAIGTDAQSPYAYYIGRQDKLVVDSVGRFNVIQGVPALLPQEPEDPKEGMVLASVYVPPYTKSMSQVKIYQRDNRRYTMKDIGKLDRRITNLEYYVALSLLEKDTATMQIKDATTGLDKFKNGFIVDQFTGHGIGDVKHSDYRVAVDSKSRQLRPMHFTTALDIVEDLDSGNARGSAEYVKNGDILTMPYTETEAIWNTNASRSIDVNPYKIGAFKGEVTLIPEGDNWKDTDRRPDLQVTDDNNFDAIQFMAEELGVTGTVWNEWQTNWTGIETSSTTWQTGNPNQRRQTVTGYETTVTTETGITSRDGIQTTLESSVNSQDYGDRVVDIAFAPYMRARPVGIVAKNLKASSRFWAFFDDTAVSEYIKPADIFKVTRASNSTLMDFSAASIDPNVLADDPSRAMDGEIQPAFVNGDVITNSDHTATSISAINGGSAFAGGASFTVQVSTATGISPGHHVQLYNLNYHRARTRKSLWGLHRNRRIPASENISSTTSTARELNLKTFKVLSMSGTTLTLGNIDGSNVDAFSAYNTSSYSSSSRGQLLRLTASGVVVYDGYVEESDEYGNRIQELHVLNVKNGFGINDTITGSTQIGTTTSLNNCVITSINGDDDVDAAPTMKVLGDPIRTDIDGAVVALFNIPNNNSLAFRTGERTLKLIDNVSNSDADFDSKGSAVYYSQGVTLSKERTIVNSRSANFVQDRLYEELPARRTSTSTRVLYSYYTGHDPIAQTFTVQATGGQFVTSVDVFFAEAGNRPITVELRSTNNGVPSTKIIPFSDVTKTPQEVATSDDGSLATTFTFRAPIYLQDGETYALIVKTDEPGCQLFISELGKEDVITGNIITSQPLTGSLYLSQNSKEFEINPLLDMKFTLRKAVFDNSTPVNVLLRANPPLAYNLPNNPFEVTPGTTKIRISAPKHGFLAGELVSIEGVPENNYGTDDADTGIPADILNGDHTVLTEGLELDSFVIDLDIEDDDGNSTLSGGATTADFIKGEYGGLGARMTRSLNLDSLFMRTNDLNFQDTNIQYYLDAEDKDGNFTGYTSFVPNSNFFFGTRKHIRSYDNQTVVTESPLVKKSSLRFKAVLTSSNPNVSPLIDLAQLSGYSVTNLVDDYLDTDINVTDIDTRVLLDTLTTADVRNSTPNGSITATTSSATITGSGTAFQSEVKSGDKIYTSGGTLLGTVNSISSQTSLTLTANSASSVTANSNWQIQSPPNLSFTNTDGLGLIATNIDVADNLLANAEVGKKLIISNAHANVNGTYTIKRVETITDSNTLAANGELDAINLWVEPAFSGNATIDMVSDSDFEISMLDRWVDDFAPVNSTNGANYITRTLSLAEAADSLKIMFDASIISRTSVEVYYRTWDGEVDPNTINWVNTDFIIGSNDSEGSFTERTIDVDNMDPFTNVQLKIVMRSSQQAKVPAVKNLRAIAHS
jgi:hypothetical protein